MFSDAAILKCNMADRWSLATCLHQKVYYTSSNIIFYQIWYSYPTLLGPFPTILNNIKIIIYKCRPSLKSIWLLSQCFKIYLFDYLVAKYNFCHLNEPPILLSFGNVEKNMFSEAAVLESKMADGYRGPPTCFHKKNVFL